MTTKIYLEDDTEKTFHCPKCGNDELSMIEKCTLQRKFGEIFCFDGGVDYGELQERDTGEIEYDDDAYVYYQCSNPHCAFSPQDRSITGRDIREIGDDFLSDWLRKNCM